MHPALVHVPMGLWPMALLFDLLSFLGMGSDFYFRLSFYAILLGLIVALLAIAPGWADWSGIKREKPAWRLGLYHLIFNVVAIVVWLANLLVRVPELGEGADRVSGMGLGLSFIGTAILGIGAWFGKRMVFNEGTSVARTSKKELRKAAKKGGAAVPEE